jgi:hypothetical protein
LSSDYFEIAFDVFPLINEETEMTGARGRDSWVDLNFKEENGYGRRQTD